METSFDWGLYPGLDYSFLGTVGIAAVASSYGLYRFCRYYFFRDGLDNKSYISDLDYISHISNDSDSSTSSTVIAPVNNAVQGTLTTNPEGLYYNTEAVDRFSGQVSNLVASANHLVEVQERQLRMAPKVVEDIAEIKSELNRLEIEANKINMQRDILLSGKAQPLQLEYYLHIGIGTDSEILPKYFDIGVETEGDPVYYSEYQYTILI